MKEIVKYPIGEQSFEKIRTEGMLYVDKTQFIDTMLSSGSRYYFLGRPRRFGKSLFLSTLKCFFEGKRELFEGLYADGMAWDWGACPVFHLDLNVGDFSSGTSLSQRLDVILGRWEKEWGVAKGSPESGTRFEALLEAAHHKTGKRCVVLVDEYDKPLVHNLGDDKAFGECREILTSLYSNFKSGTTHLELVFLTGVSRFAHLSVFSGLNNLNDITFDDDYSAICGITGPELDQYFGSGIEEMAVALSKDIAAVKHELRRHYDGYRFSPSGVEIYNPFSLLCAFQKRSMANYWAQTGLPTMLVKQMKRLDTDLASLIQTTCTPDDLRWMDLDNAGAAPLLYQTGYLTIKETYPQHGLVRLGIPNREVEASFMEFLLPYYADIKEKRPATLVYEFVTDLEKGEAEAFMQRLQVFFASISYDMEMHREQNLHNALLILLKLIGLHVQTELRTSSGRIDIFVGTAKYVYIMELKQDGSASAALA